MAYVVPRQSGSWELRHSVATPAGPRSRTLASFRVLTDDVVDRVVERSRGELDADQLKAAARRAGAPVAAEPALAAGAELLGQLSRGARLPSRWRHLLASLLAGDPTEPSAAEEAAAAWAGRSLEERGEALRDLLLLADRIGPGRRGERSSFPRLVSTAR